MSHSILYGVGVLLLVTASNAAGTFTNFTETDSGCNVTLLCLHAPLELNSSIVWIYGSSEVVTGPRTKVATLGFFSTLTILVLTRRDSGLYTCVTPQANRTVSLEVREECTDKHSGCRLTVEKEGTKSCKGKWMKTMCRFSCELCPKQNCSKTEIPTFPAETTTATSEKTTKPDRTESQITLTSTVSTRPSESLSERRELSNALSVQNHKIAYFDYFLAAIGVIVVAVCNAF